MDTSPYQITQVNVITQAVDDHDSFMMPTSTSKPRHAADSSTPQEMSDCLLSRSTMLLKRHYHDTMVSDFSPPCPWMALHCPYPCFCCCIVPRAIRQQFALTLLYSRFYLIVYLLIIAITVTLFVYAVAQTEGDVLESVTYEPQWLIAVDLACVGLMIFDVAIQIQAHHKRYWKSAMNIFDLTVVLLCVSYIPVYFHVIEHGAVLSILLSIRFITSFLRIAMVYKHQMDRKAFMEAAEADVDFHGDVASFVISKTHSASWMNRAPV